MHLFRNILIASALLFSTAAAAAEGRADKAVLEVVKNSRALSGANVSVSALTVSGETIASLNPDQVMMPASNLKLITTGAALKALGSDYTFKTTIAYSGSITGGILEGDVYIIGGADPMLGAQDTLAFPVQKTFAAWKKILGDNGIKRINGRIIGDGRFIDGVREEPSWLWEDIGTYYGTGMSGLGFCENYLNFRVTAGKAVGDSLSISQRYPLSPWLDIRYDCLTGEKGTGDRLYLYTTDFCDMAVLRGTFGVDKGTKNVLCSNKYPELTCALLFSEYLKECALDSKGVGYVTGYTSKVWSPGKGFEDFKAADELTEIGSTESPKLFFIAKKTNYESNNFVAETLLRILGREKASGADYPAALKAEAAVISSLGLSTSSKGVRIVDGSGLSRKNTITAAFMCRFLAAMADSDCFEDYLLTIPNLPGSSAITAGNREKIRRKTGSMEGVYCISGYYEGEETIIFSILINGSRSSTSETRAAAERILAAIIGQ